MEEKMQLMDIINLEASFSKIYDFDVLLEEILLRARHIVHADAGSIYVKDIVEKNGIARKRLSIRYAQNDTLQKQLEPGNKLLYTDASVAIDNGTMSGYSAYSAQIINVPDVYHIPTHAPYSFSPFFDELSGYKTISALSVPLIGAENNLLGVIQVINAIDEQGTVYPFSKDDELVISMFAMLATTALERAIDTRRMILRMIKMTEYRDPKETGAHVRRVSGYAVEIYDYWADIHHIAVIERERFRDALKIAAMLHDVGKIAISDTILKKPERLTHAEIAIMQTHTTFGAGLFDEFQSPMDSLAREVALYHHENWDGTGYPSSLTGKGLKGTAIPLSARIVAVADVYDALSSRRTYKEPWDEMRVHTEMKRCTGTKFDPELIDIFFKILPYIKHLQALYPET